MDKAGVIYILTNPSFPDFVKIGYADDIEKRLQQLNRSECIPFAFRVYATYEVNSRLSNLKIHFFLIRSIIGTEKGKTSEKNKFFSNKTYGLQFSTRYKNNQKYP